jgi:hypothetical protein
MKDIDILIRQTYEAELVADSLIDKIIQIKDGCRKAREKMTSVSTPVLQKGLNKKEQAKIIVRREGFIRSSVKEKTAGANSGK